METRTYSHRSNARRAARAAGIDPDAVVQTDEGFAVHFNGHDQHGVSPIVAAVDVAIERGLSPEDFAAETEEVADELDIPDFCKLSSEQRREAWRQNPPKSALPKESLTMSKAKPRKIGKPSGADKNGLLLAMLKGKGSTVDAFTKALGWLPHTLRARLSRLSKPKNKGGEGLKIERARTDGVTTYRSVS